MPDIKDKLAEKARLFDEGKPELSEQRQGARLEKEEAGKSKRKAEKTSFYLTPDAKAMLNAMSVAEGKKQSHIVEELIVDRFKHVYSEYPEEVKAFIKMKYSQDLSEE